MLRFIGGFGLAVLLAPSAGAQVATAELPDDQAIGDIVVTAQKRAENVQDVPIAISAFTASALRERAILDVSQLANNLLKG